MVGTIQTKRASGRGAPPQVYVPFGNLRDDKDAGEDCKRAAIELSCLLAWFVFLGMVLAGLCLMFPGLRDWINSPN